MILTLVALYVVLCAVFFFTAKRAPLGVEDEAGFRLATAEEAAAPVVALAVSGRRSHADAATTILR